MKFSELQQGTQEILKKRFGEYGLPTEYIYNETSYFSPEMKNLSESQFLEIFDNKHISHIYPRKHFPELEGEPWNVFLEDEFENISRSSNIVTSQEINAAYFDQIQDIQDFDIDDDGIIDLSYFQDDFDSALEFDSWDFDFYEYLL